MEAGRSCDRENLYYGSLDSPNTQKIDGIHSRAEFVDGHLLFGEGNTLYAQKFDVESVQLDGERIRLADGLGLSFGEAAAYAFSSGHAAVVYAGGGCSPTRNSSSSTVKVAG